MTERDQTRSGMTDEQAKALLDRPILDDEMKHAMLTRLGYTADRRERNVLALKLAEVGYKEAIPVLSKLLYVPDTAGARGTLLYSIDELGAKLGAKELLHLMLTETYEVQIQAFEMLENEVADLSHGDVRNLLNMVLDMAATLDPEHRQAAEAASELLVSTYFESGAPARAA